MIPFYDFKKYSGYWEGGKRPKTPAIVGPAGTMPKEGGVCVIRREAIDLPDQYSLIYSLLTSPGPVRASRIFSGCVILAGSTVSLESVGGGIVIADGDESAQF